MRCAGEFSVASFAEYLRCDTQEGFVGKTNRSKDASAALRRRSLCCESSQEDSLLRLHAGEYPPPPSHRTRILCCAAQENSPLREGAGSSVALRRRFLRCELSQDDSLLRCAGGSSAANLLAATIDAPRRCLRDVAPCRLSLDAGPGRQGAWLETWLALARSANKGVPL